MKPCAKAHVNRDWQHAQIGATHYWKTPADSHIWQSARF